MPKFILNCIAHFEINPSVDSQSFTNCNAIEFNLEYFFWANTFDVMDSHFPSATAWQYDTDKSNSAVCVLVFFDHPLGWPCNAIEITEKCLVRTIFDAEDEIAARLCNLFAHRVIGIQVIAQVNRTQRCVARCVLNEPAVGGFGFAVLFLIAVLRRDKLRSQRQHLAVADANQCGAQHDMVIFALARASKSGATLWTLNLVRVVELRPIQCQKAAPVENLERLKGLIFLHLIKRYVESRVNILTVDSVQLLSNMIVSWQFADAE